MSNERPMNHDIPELAGQTFRPPTGEIPVYQPINLTEQIPLEYSVPATYGPLPKRPISKTPRPATIIWGLIVLATGLGFIASAAGQEIDFGLAAIWLLGAAGLALVAVAVVSAVRRSSAS